MADITLENIKYAHSPITEFKARKLIREYLFDIKDNIKLCMKLDAEIYYKFLIQPHKKNEDYKKDEKDEESVLRNYAAELVEYDDMIELQKGSQYNWQETIFEWILSLKNKHITYNHAVIFDVHSIINIEKIQETLRNLKINVFDFTEDQSKNLVWGHFEDTKNSNMFAVIGEGAISQMLSYKNKIDHFDNVISQLYYYYQENPNENPLYFVNDNIGVFDWTYSEEIDPVDEDDAIIAIVNIYSSEEMLNLFTRLNFQRIKVCQPQNLSIAVITSSFLYNNMLENVLPYYDWLFWMDMDAIIANPNITIESLLDKFRLMVEDFEDIDFDDIDLIVAKPSHDHTINAGIFLIRNSDWSKEFLEDVQLQQQYFKTKMYEQGAMWDLIQEPKYKSKVMLDRDDHTFNTFPKNYVSGDFIIHFAPDGCPAESILDAFVKLEEYQNNPDMEISF
ncbi:8904_t:CDS:2 [Diversispora eburnea]|uniref:8904_t:CDS:1 n=1 Tax=Diversispora eburnea TaxID=1213867 RepID=A0A9N8W0X5_9GLOM|nr:8904_t:CDS:2 [Diversispora eburnea]